MTLASPDRTGASRMALAFCRALRQSGHEICLHHGREPAASILPDLRAVGVEVCPEPGLSFPLSGSVSRRVADAARSRGSGAVIGVNQRDRAVALQAASRIGKPGLLAVQSRHQFWGRWPIAALKRHYYRTVLQHKLTLAICCSEAVQTELIEQFGIAAGRTTVVPNGIDPARFSRLAPEDAAAVRAELGLRPEELMLLTVGRIDSQKGLDLLFEAVARLSTGQPWRLVVVGGMTEGAGNQRSRLYHRQLLARLQKDDLAGRVLMAGWREDTPRLLGASHLYVHAARYEGWPLAVLEAMAARLPVVASDCVGRPQGFVDGRHGYIVATDNVPALTQGLERALAVSAEERAAWGDAARELVLEHYDVAGLARKFVQLVEGELA